MNTEFYKMMLEEKRKRECSIRKLAEICELCPGTLIYFFDTKQRFKPLQEKTMAKIHNHLGIPYEVMEEYNREVTKERG